MQIPNHTVTAYTALNLTETRNLLQNLILEIENEITFYSDDNSYREYGGEDVATGLVELLERANIWHTI